MASTDEATLEHALLEIARTLARGGDIDTKLTRLADQARRLSGAPVCLFYLLDSASRELVPAGVAELSDEAHQALTTNADDPGVALARAVRERRPETLERDDASRFAVLATGIASVRCFPLVAEDATGTQEVQGALVACFAGDLDPTAADDALSAFADIAAVTIRSVRLERALIERSDWYDRVAHSDPLTGLANRRTFDQMVELELLRAARQGSPLSIVLFDIDGLARITDEHGASVGDEVLRRVAASLADTVRLVDTVARVGADEFGLVAPGSIGETVARRVVDAVASLGTVNGSGAIGLSAGLARFPEDGTTRDELITAADEALREAKRRGGATVLPVGER